MAGAARPIRAGILAMVKAAKSYPVAQALRRRPQADSRNNGLHPIRDRACFFLVLSHLLNTRFSTLASLTPARSNCSSTTRVRAMQMRRIDL